MLQGLRLGFLTARYLVVNKRLVMAIGLIHDGASSSSVAGTHGRAHWAATRQSAKGRWRGISDHQIFQISWPVAGLQSYLMAPETRDHTRVKNHAGTMSTTKAQDDTATAGRRSSDHWGDYSASRLCSAPAWAFTPDKTHLRRNYRLSSQRQ